MYPIPLYTERLNLACKMSQGWFPHIPQDCWIPQLSYQFFRVGTPLFPIDNAPYHSCINMYVVAFPTCSHPPCPALAPSRPSPFRRSFQFLTSFSVIPCFEDGKDGSRCTIAPLNSFTYSSFDHINIHEICTWVSAQRSSHP